MYDTNYQTINKEEYYTNEFNENRDQNREVTRHSISQINNLFINGVIDRYSLEEYCKNSQENNRIPCNKDMIQFTKGTPCLMIKSNNKRDMIEGEYLKVINDVINGMTYQKNKFSYWYQRHFVGFSREARQLKNTINYNGMMVDGSNVYQSGEFTIMSMMGDPTVKIKRDVVAGTKLTFVPVDAPETVEQAKKISKPIYFDLIPQEEAKRLYEKELYKTINDFEANGEEISETGDVVTDSINTFMNGLSHFVNEFISDYGAENIKGTEKKKENTEEYIIIDSEEKKEEGTKVDVGKLVSSNVQNAIKRTLVKENNGMTGIERLMLSFRNLYKPVEDATFVETMENSKNCEARVFYLANK